MLNIQAVCHILMYSVCMNASAMLCTVLTSVLFECHHRSHCNWGIILLLYTFREWQDWIWVCIFWWQTLYIQLYWDHNICPVSLWWPGRLVSCCRSQRHQVLSRCRVFPCWLLLGMLHVCVLLQWVLCVLLFTCPLLSIYCSVCSGSYFM